MTASTRPAAGRRIIGWRAWLIWSVAVIDVVVVTASSAFGLTLTISLVLGAITASFALVGATLVTRLPRNPIGWIYLVAASTMSWAITGASWVISDVASTSVVSGPALLVAFLANVAFAPLLGAVGIFVPLLFPTGSLPSRRWRPGAWFGVLATAATTAYVMLRPGPMSSGAEVLNPLGVTALAPLLDTISAAPFGSLLLAYALAASSAVWRYRNGPRLERQQLRWFAWSVVVMVGAIAVALSGIGPLADVSWVVMLAGLALIPVSTGLAILRYRLYDLDRLVSRTVTYGVVTGLLVGAYIALTLVLSGPFGALTGGGTLPVAVSTLAVAALFQPLRLRIQRILDRRFDRAHYDGERTAAAFGGRLRDEVDLPTVTADLDATVRRVLAPGDVTVWLRIAPSDR